MVFLGAKVKSNTFQVKLLWLLFRQLFQQFGLLFNSASGHYVPEQTLPGGESGPERS